MASGEYVCGKFPKKSLFFLQKRQCIQRYCPKQITITGTIKEFTNTITYTPDAAATGRAFPFGGSGIPPFFPASPPPVWITGSSPTLLTPALPVAVPSATVALPSQSAAQSNTGSTAPSPPFILPQFTVSTQYSLTTLPTLQEKPPTAESMSTNIYSFNCNKTLLFFAPVIFPLAFSSELAEYTKKNKSSLRRRVKNYLSTDWLPEDMARTFSLRENYVQPNCLRKKRNALRDKFAPIRGIHNIFDNLREPRPANILLIG